MSARSRRSTVSSTMSSSLPLRLLRTRLKPRKSELLTAPIGFHGGRAGAKFHIFYCVKIDNGHSDFRENRHARFQFPFRWLGQRICPCGNRRSYHSAARPGREQLCAHVHPRQSCRATGPPGQRICPCRTSWPSYSPARPRSEQLCARVHPGRTCRATGSLHPELHCFRRSIPRMYAPLSTLRVLPRGSIPRMTRGQCGSLLLYCDGLSPSTSCRSSRRTAAQWLAYTLPYRRFADALADACAQIGGDVDCYSFIAVDFHHILLASLPAHSLMLRPAGLLSRLKQPLSRGSSPCQLPSRAARQLPDQSTTLRVESSSTDDPRLRGALPKGDMARQF